MWLIKWEHWFSPVGLKSTGRFDLMEVKPVMLKTLKIFVFSIVRQIMNPSTNMSEPTELVLKAPQQRHHTNQSHDLSDRRSRPRMFVRAVDVLLLNTCRTSTRSWRTFNWPKLRTRRTFCTFLCSNPERRRLTTSGER